MQTDFAKRWISTWIQVLSYVGKIALLRQTIEDSAGQVFFEAEMKVGLFDLQARKLIEPSEGWLKAIGHP